ncbi:MAG: peptidoglycan DD-metalloendopeptidase family protein [Alphaproteobacteria bacterium]|nr:peptidoglycan DD-metalloendopeptidase family protein [Alphaproteobacteria bacterium]
MAAFAAAMWVVAPVLVYAQDNGANPTQERLQNVRKTLERDTKTAEALARDARKQASELSELRTKMRVAAQAVQTHEAALDSLETELTVLEGEAARKQVQLEARRSDLGSTLAALQRMALRPTAALLVSPGDPNDVVRSGLLLRTAVPEIERQARLLRADIDTLTGLQVRIRNRKDELQTAAVDLKRERLRLKALSDAKNKVLTQTKGAQASAEKRVAGLRAEARTLEELLSNLRDSTASAVPQPRPNSQRPQQNLVTPTLEPSGPSIASARGQLSLPAQGTVVRRFGTRTEAGVSATGVTWKTRAEASVVAPWDGRIVFAGPFRRFGQILIIDHGEGYHSLIAGLGQIDAQMDQWVLAGEPVGTTGTGADAKSGGRASQAQSRSDGARLYVELRRDGQPINPLPWLAAQTNRTQG